MSSQPIGSARIGELLLHPPKNPVARLLNVLRFDRKTMILAFVGTVIASILSLAQPMLAGLITGALGERNFDLLIKFGIALVALAIGSSLFTAAVNLIVTYSGNRLVRAFRDESAAIAMRMPAEKLVDHPTADLVSRCSIDSEKMGDIFTRGPIQALGGLVLVFGSLAQMIVIDPVLTAAALGLTLGSFALIVVVSNRLTGIAYDRQEAQGEYVAEITRALDSLLVLRAFVSNAFAFARLAKTSKKLQEAANRSAKAEAFMQPLVTVAVQTTLLVIVFVAFLRVQDGALGVDGLVAFFMYTMMLIGPVSGATETVMLMAETLGSLQRLVDLRQIVERPSPAVAEVRELVDSMGLEEYGNRPKADPNVLEGDISFRNVSVKYGDGNLGGREYAIQDVSFDIAKGSWVTLTGTSGSGKSTILSLMERFVLPSQGLILIDGIPLNDRDEDIYRSQVGYIEQSCPLFAGTVRDNLLLGRTDISDDECWDILEKVGLANTINSRQGGLDAPVGESAYAFSGGERQRISIARTLLRKPRMLLLDEITSGLDVVNREQIMDLIRQSMGDITTLAAGHGKYGTEWADKVLVMHEGRLVENGTPAEITQRSELFRSLTAH